MHTSEGRSWFRCSNGQMFMSELTMWPLTRIIFEIRTDDTFKVTYRRKHASPQLILIYDKFSILNIEDELIKKK